jgi:enoyl-CoA hydratase/carnithine racemase
MGARRLIRCERIGAVARITLDQPERGNVVDAAMAMDVGRHRCLPGQTDTPFCR